MRKKIKRLWNFFMALQAILVTAIYFLIQNLNLRFLFIFSILTINILLQITFLDIIKYKKTITKKGLINSIFFLVIGIFIAISPILSTMKSNVNMYFYIFGILICLNSINNILNYLKSKK